MPSAHASSHAKRRRPTRIEAKPEKKAKPMYLSRAQVRRQAEVAFVKDPDNHTQEWHFENGGYRKYISFSLYKGWVYNDKWVDKRVQYWRNIQNRVLSHLADKILDKKLEELNEMQIVRDALVETLMPLRDEDGKVIRDKKTGMPKFAIELPPYDKLMKAFLDLDLRIGLRTGEATSRIDTTGGSLGTPDPVASLVKLSKPEAEMLARNLLEARNKQLIETEAEEDDDEDL